MTLKRLFMTSGLSALAAAMAMTSLPGAGNAAEMPDRAEQRDNRGSVDRESRAERRAARIESRGEARSENRGDSRREARSEQQVQQPRDAGSREQRWGRSAPVQERTVTREVTRTVERDRNNRGSEAVQRQRDLERSGQWAGRDQRAASDRNSGYADRDRNRSYSDRNRDGYRDRADRDRRGDYRDGRNDRNYSRDGRRDARNDRNHYRDHRSWDRKSWRNSNRYNWYGYRASNRNIFRLGHYYAPYRDYRYSRVNIGFRLGSVFFGSRYWINDPWQYRLPEVYGPYRWVRYYDDVLLVDIYSGEVVDVIYDFFW